MKRVLSTIKTNVTGTVWKYYIFNFLWHLHFFSAVLIPFFTDWGGITQTQVQFLQSWFMFWIFVLEVPTGAVADYLGRKYSLAMGALVVTFGALIYGSVPKFEIFLLGEFLFATCFALMSGADKALLYDALKESGREEESKKIFGRSHSIGLTSMMIAAPVGGFIASQFGTNAPMLFFSIPALLACIVALTIPEPKVKKAVSESKRYLTIAKDGFLFFYKHKTLRALAIDAMLVASTAYFVLWLYQPMLQKLEIPVVFFGFIHSTMILAEVLVASNFVALEKFFGSASRYLKITALVTGLSFILLAIFPNIVTVLLFVIFAGGLGLTRLEYVLAHMNKFIPSESRATVLSSISMFRRFFLVFLNPIVGFTVDFSLGVALFAVGLISMGVFFFSPVKKEMLEEK